MSWIYRPNHPLANENGMVERHLVRDQVNNTAPYVISDNMEPSKHMGTGRVIDSKAKFRAETRASGCVEIGNESIKTRQPVKLNGEQRRNDIRKAIYELRNGR